MGNIEQLKTETKKIETDLKALKDNVSISDADKKKEEEKLKLQAETTKQKVQSEIDSLKDKTDDVSKKKKEEVETLLNSLDEVLSLESSVKNEKVESSQKKADWNETLQEDENKEKKDWWTESSKQNSDEEKSVWWKTKDRVWEQWDDVWDKEKRKEEWWKNLLRTAWFVATGVWAVALAYKWVKKLWNRAFWDKDEEEWDENEDENTEQKSKKKNKKKSDWESFWDWTIWKTIKTVWSVLAVWSWAYYLVHWLYTKNRWLNDLWDWEIGKKLEFDAAMDYCKWAISNQDNIEWMAYGMDLKYHEDTWEIEAYWEKIKIDKNNRKIVWLDVEFKKYEHMINTAIVVAYLKKNYSWKCSSNAPFDLNWSWQWDVNVATQEGSQEAVDWTWNWWRIVWIWTAAVASIITAIWSKNIKLWATVLTAWWALWFAWWYLFDKNNIMNNHMPELDDENGRKNLAAYLNWMECREAKNQTSEDITESPIKKELVECMEEIQKTSQELPNLWDVRKIDAIPDPNDEKKYIIKAFNRELLAEVTWKPGNRRIRILWISWWNPTIKTNMEKSWLSNLNLPLKEWLYMSCLTWFLLNNYHHKWNKYPWFEYTWRTNHAFKEWIYFSNDWTDTRVYSKDAFQQKMPTLFQKENRKKYLEFLNDWITWENNISIRKK